jgi:hypothetical protein
MQYSTKIRNAQLEKLVYAIGPSPVLQFRSGPPPADCGSRDSGALLSEIALSDDWLGRAGAGQILNGYEWVGKAMTDGKIGHFRIKNNGKTVTHLQGTVSEAGGDMTIEDAHVLKGETFRVKTFGIQAGNA